MIKRWKKVKKKATGPLPEAKEKLMALAKKYIKLRDEHTCWSCGKQNLSGKDLHGGHFIPDSIGGVILRYDEDNIHPQCLHCNHFLSGNQAEYYRKMVEVYGQEFVDEMFRKKHQDTTKWSLQDYQDKIYYYQNKIKELDGTI